MSEWFPSFDAIPGVEWQPLVAIDSSKLKHTDATMKVERYRWYDGAEERTRTVWIDSDGTELDGSPCNLHAQIHDDGLAPRTVARRISEAMAVPGTRSDYHFALMSAWNALYGTRREDPTILGMVERLCLADISMMAQGPDRVFDEDHWTDVNPAQLAVPSVNQLSSMYVREGFISAAAEIEQRFGALAGEPRPMGQDLIDRRAALLEEDGR